MSTALMTQIQTLIYSNQDKLEALVDALESVCEEGATLVAPATKHPLEGYTISEKDIGSFVNLDSDEVRYIELVNLIQDKDVYGRDWGLFTKEDTVTPYIDTIKLHFRPFHATKDSAMPSDVKVDSWTAILMENGTIGITQDPHYYCWKDNGEGDAIIGYQILSFVNPVLGK